MDQINVTSHSRELWDKGKLVGQKAPLKLKEIWAIHKRRAVYPFPHAHESPTVK